MKYLLTVLGLICLDAGIAQAQAASQVETGKKVYIKNCLACHLADGAGVAGLNPPLSKTDWVTGNKVKLINVVLLGLEDPVKVNGEEYFNPMPPQPNLTDKEIADVLTYIRASFGNKAIAITTAEVTKQRAKVLPGGKPKK